MSRTLVVVLLLLVGAAPSSAQTPRMDLSAGYAFMRDLDRSENFPLGWAFAVTGNITDWIGVVSEVGGSHRSCDDCQRGPFTSEAFRGTDRHLRVFNFMVGPRVALRDVAGVTPFAQFLLGGAHISGGVQFDGALTTGFSYQPGGGVDIHVTPTLGLRLQGDYRIVRTQGNNGESTRFMAGIVWHSSPVGGG